MPRTLSSKPGDDANDRGYESQTGCKKPHFFILGGDKDHGEDLKQDLGRTCVGVCMWFPSFPQDLNIQAIHDQFCVVFSHPLQNKKVGVF